MKKKLKKTKYDLNQSPLFKLSTKRKLAALLHSSPKELLCLISHDDNYHVFSLADKNGKTRLIEQPKERINKLHQRMHDLLTRIQTPDYLHSGVKGRSYITNAKEHVDNPRMIKLDIEKFYPSTTNTHVFNFFRHIMKCSSDVAGILTRMCTFQGHIPTGSCLSQSLAFYSHRKMFNDINDFSKNIGSTMTTYVDDIVISGQTASLGSLNIVRMLIKRNNLRSKRKKERVYGDHDAKLVTGVILKNSSMLLPNNRHKEIFEQFKTKDTITNSEKNSLRGMINSAAQIDKIFIKKLSLV